MVDCIQRTIIPAETITLDLILACCDQCQAKWRRFWEIQTIDDPLTIEQLHATYPCERPTE